MKIEVDVYSNFGSKAESKKTKLYSSWQAAMKNELKGSYETVTPCDDGRHLYTNGSKAIILDAPGGSK